MTANHDPLPESEKREIFRWLERTNPSSLHNSAARKHEPHTSAWLLRLQEWEHWQSEKSTDRFLWIHGPPGTGKTVLTSFTVEKIKTVCNGSRGLGYAYYYCHYSHNKDEAVPFLSWTVSQACRQTGWVPGQLKSLYDRGCDASIPELESILETVLERLDVFYVIVDAVDESAPRDDLLDLIATLVLDKRFRKIKILASSRPYFDIERLFSGISAAVSMSNPSVNDDIRQFVRSRLASSYRLRRWRHHFKEIENTLVTHAQGMYVHA